ncbi:hypothetical protein [Halarcobacter ebronensis]|uniref:Uncharacterized protein n=1 Tax=Halarcobacter ebronensis TaxID=1462615 RepID=A0A4Q1AX60_9BACT|nr:hypothetical protein [Halarcobacter ebronensis]QKF81597.1 hypothetical protein AEBR_1101 [Halarcobacter ebronensis]RXK05525.1 hypothetical protein CRV07_08415 [Halarcobacter ebronensis]
MSILGKCPYCNGAVISKKFITNAKEIKLYSCENAKKEYDESEQYVFTSDSTCTFRVYSNAFLRWNKRSFSENEMRRLLSEGQTKVRLHGRKGSKEYYKYVVPNEEYGVTILWDEEVESA